jgi:hypothetical protein
MVEHGNLWENDIFFFSLDTRSLIEYKLYMNSRTLFSWTQCNLDICLVLQFKEALATVLTQKNHVLEIGK